MSPLSEVVFRMIQDVPQRIPGDVEPCIGFIFSMREQIAVSVKAHDAFIIGDDPIDHQLIIAQVRQQHAETLPGTGIVDILIDRLPVFLADICTGCQQGEHRFVCGSSVCPAVIKQGWNVRCVSVPGMARIQSEIDRSQVVTAKCSEPQVVDSDVRDGGSGVAILSSVRTETGYKAKWWIRLLNKPKSKR